MTDPYTTLNVLRTASPADIRLAYRRLAMRWHPDRPEGNAAHFQEIKTAFETLSDPVRRAKLSEAPQDNGCVSAMTLDYINLRMQYPDIDGTCSTCGGTRSVRVAVGKIAYRKMPCPKCGESKEQK